MQKDRSSCAEKQSSEYHHSSAKCTLVRLTSSTDRDSFFAESSCHRQRQHSMDPIDLLAHQVMIVAGISMLICGTIGNMLNIYVFTLWSRCRNSSHHLGTDRSSHCPLYLLLSSWANLIAIVYPFLTRIMFDGYDYLITPNTTFIFCKFRYFILHTSDLISLMCICLATFDRYLISSRNAHLRTLNTNKQQTFVLIGWLIVTISAHSVPVAIYYDVSPTGECYISSEMYSYYYLYIFQIILHSFIPMIFLTLFGTLTYRNLKSRSMFARRRHRHGDKQLSRMLVLMSITIVLSSIPYCIEQFIYIMIYHGTDHHRTSFIFFYHVISTLLFYTNPVASFYIFYVSTRSFRVQIHKLFHFGHTHRLFASSQVHSISHT